MGHPVGSCGRRPPALPYLALQRGEAWAGPCMRGVMAAACLARAVLRGACLSPSPSRGGTSTATPGRQCPLLISSPRGLSQRELLINWHLAIPRGQGAGGAQRAICLQGCKL